MPRLSGKDKTRTGGEQPMASEQKRGCGYRKVGALYLCGGSILATCDRLPYELKSCPVCGAGIHFTRAMTEINPLKLFGIHDSCQDTFRPCKMCDPKDEPAYIMMVGKGQYSPTSFLQEAQQMGVSKRIAQIPKHLKLGETVVYLAHPQAIQNAIGVTADNNGQGKMISDKLGIFCAFIPQRIEMPVWRKQLKGKGSRKFKQSLKKRGITPVPINDGDKDHAP